MTIAVILGLTIAAAWTGVLLLMIRINKLMVTKMTDENTRPGIVEARAAHALRRADDSLGKRLDQSVVNLRGVDLSGADMRRGMGWIPVKLALAAAATALLAWQGLWISILALAAAVAAVAWCNHRQSR